MKTKFACAAALAVSVLCSAVTARAADTSVQGADLLGQFSKVDEASDFVFFDNDDKTEDPLYAYGDARYRYKVVFKDEKGYFTFNPVTVDEANKLYLNTKADLEAAKFTDANFYVDLVNVSLDYDKHGTAYVFVRSAEENSEVKFVCGVSGPADIVHKDVKKRDYNPKVAVTVTANDGKHATLKAVCTYNEEMHSKETLQLAYVSRFELYMGEELQETKFVEPGTHTAEFEVGGDGRYSVQAFSSNGFGKSAEVEVSGIGASEIVTTADGDSRKPNIRFSEMPSEAYTGTEIDVTMYSDKPAILMLDGVSSVSAVTEYTFKVSRNGQFKWYAQDWGSNVSEGTLDVKFFVDAPAFDPNNRDGEWGTPVESMLPQTGGVSYLPLLLAGVLAAVCGVLVAFPYFKRRLGIGK